MNPSPGSNLNPLPRSASPHSASPRGRPSSPRPPPSYARSSLDRSPSVNPMVLDERPRVPPPIYLRSSSPQGHSGKGTLKIFVPAWGVALVRPPNNRDLHPLESGGVEREPPCQDTVLSGALEVTMKERRRVQAISVGVQSVCRLHMGATRGWEEDGIFERGVEVLAAEGEEGIWLEKGSQSFSFSILLPATLAASDSHAFGRVSYILTARVEGISSGSSLTSIFKVTSPPMLDQDIPNRGDFERVIARSDKLASASASGHGLSGALKQNNSSKDSLLGLEGLSVQDSPSLLDDPSTSATAIAVGEGSPSLRGLYTRRQSSSLSPRVPPMSLSPSAPGQSRSQSQSQSASPDESPTVPKSRSASMSQTTPSGSSARLASDSGSGSGFGSGSSVSKPNVASPKTEKAGWMKGDLCASRAMIVHANPSRSGGVTQLDLRKEGFVDGLGNYRFSATAEVFSISSVILLSVACPSPSPRCTIFLIRLILSQGYSITSPRTPNKAPHVPEATKHHVLYQVGRPHRPGELRPGRDVDALWRGTEAGGEGFASAGTGASAGMSMSTEEGWKIRAVIRMPDHNKIRPTSHHGTITPIRVTHEFILQVFYSIDGECVRGDPIEGPGELRMMTMKVPIAVPSCCLVEDALDLPTYECAHRTPKENIDAILSSPPSKNQCMCGSTFAELGEAAMRRYQAAEQEQGQDEVDGGAGSGGTGSGHSAWVGAGSGTGAGSSSAGSGSGSGSGFGVHVDRERRGSNSGKEMEARREGG